MLYSETLEPDIEGEANAVKLTTHYDNDLTWASIYSDDTVS